MNLECVELLLLDHGKTHLGGYQLTQSLMAFGRENGWDKGWETQCKKLEYLPEIFFVAVLKNWALLVYYVAYLDLLSSVESDYDW